MTHRDKTARDDTETSTGWVASLLAWFSAHRRAMPWRDDPRPYAVWISEMMLQQTQVTTVMPRFDAFMRRFPDVRALAAAALQDVLKAWEGLGYYARARNLHRAAQVLVDAHGGQLPRTAAALRALPGIGDYASAAIASIAHGEPAPAVDGNVLRVIARFRGITDDIARPATRVAIHDWLVPHIRKADPSLFNQALMELGALVCRPRNPDCAQCPLAAGCVARATRQVDRLPVKSRQKPGPHHQEVMAVIRRGGRVLLARRPAEGLLGGLWEFPTGRRRARETDSKAAARVAADIAGLRVLPKQSLTPVKHAFSHFRITVQPVLCGAEAGNAQAGGAVIALRWVTGKGLAALPLTKVARTVADGLIKSASRSARPPTNHK